MQKLYDVLNKQVANLAVFFVKLHHYHWFVAGRHFYGLHEKFEEFYDEANELYDEVAERLLMIGGAPLSKMEDYLKVTSLVEAKGGETSAEMIASIIGDFKILKKEFTKTLEVAGEFDDEVTIDILIGALTDFDKHIWMLSALLEK